MTRCRAAALILALLTGPAFANAEDDLIACMVGKAAVAMHGQNSTATAAQRESAKLEALEIAFGACGLEEANAEQEAVYDTVADYVNLMVARMAGE